MSNLPARLDDLPGNSRQLVKAVQAQEKTELAVYEHHLATRYLAEVDRIDGEAISEVVKAALEEELNLLDWGLAQDVRGHRSAIYETNVVGAPQDHAQAGDAWNITSPVPITREVAAPAFCFFIEHTHDLTRGPDPGQDRTAQ